MMSFAPRLRKVTLSPRFFLSDKKKKKKSGDTATKIKQDPAAFTHTPFYFWSSLHSTVKNTTPHLSACTSHEEHTAHKVSEVTLHMLLCTLRSAKQIHIGLLQKVRSQEAVFPACRQPAWTLQILWFLLRLMSCLLAEC